MRAQLVGPQGASSGKAPAPPHSTTTAAVAGTAPAGWHVNMLAVVSVGWHQDVSVAHAALGQAAGMHGCAGCPRSRTVHWPGMPRNKASCCSANFLLHQRADKVHAFVRNTKVIARAVSCVGQFNSAELAMSKLWHCYASRAQGSSS